MEAQEIIDWIKQKQKRRQSRRMVQYTESYK